MKQSFTIKCNNCGAEIKLLYSCGDNETIYIWANDWQEIRIQCCKCGNILE